MADPLALPRRFGFRNVAPLDWLLLLVPVAFSIRFVPAWENKTLLFVITALSIIPLAGWLSHSTEQLSERTGPGVSGLLNATFGNATELLISLVALSKGLIEIVKAAIIGSILGNILLMLGAAMLAGGIRFHHLHFNQTGTRVAATSLGVATIGLLVPSIFQWAVPAQSASWSRVTEERLSLVIAVALLGSYAMWLLFSLVTHPELFKGRAAEEADPGSPVQDAWPVARSLAVLGAATVLIAIMSEFLTDSVEVACQSFGLTEVFVGIIVVAIVGNASEATAVLVAMKNKMDLSLNIAIGSSLQIALFVAPLLVLASHLFGNPMTLQFSLPQIAALVLAVGIVVHISGDGECNWVEGAHLIFAYFIIAALFYFLPAPPAAEDGRSNEAQPLRVQAGAR